MLDGITARLAPALFGAVGLLSKAFAVLLEALALVALASLRSALFSCGAATKAATSIQPGETSNLAWQRVNLPKLPMV